MPVAKAVPAAALANHVIVAVGSVLVAVMVVALPVQIVVPVVPAVGAAGGVAILMVTVVRVADIQPVLFVAST